MSLTRRSGSALLAAFALLTATGSVATAQEGMAPTNDLPNPYRTVEGWAKLPEGRPWGSTSAVDIGKDGTSIWVAERCGVNSCAGSDAAAGPALRLVRQAVEGVWRGPDDIAPRDLRGP